MIRRSLGLLAVLAVGLGFAASPAGAGPSSDPIAYTKGSPVLITGLLSEYWAYVPESYDETHRTPTRLLVWLHGCGGESSGDIWNVSPGGDQSWISIAPTGREGECWQPGADQVKVFAAIDDVATHFNIDERRVFLGGYSSGGDLSYRTAFQHSGSFAGILVENTAPFRDTGLSRENSLAAATRKFNVAHLAHNQDTTYPIATVREETGAMVAAGFPLDLIEVDGTHYDDPGDIVNGSAVPGTTADLRTYLLPKIEGDWVAPGPVGDPTPDPTPDPDPDPTPDPDPDPGPSARPKVKITAKPARSTRSRKAVFRFRSTITGSSFKCRIDHGKFRSCGSPKRYRGLKKGRHTFSVKATANGFAGPVSKYRWRVQKSTARDL